MTAARLCSRARRARQPGQAAVSAGGYSLPILLAVLAILAGVFAAGYRDGVARCEAQANRDKLAAVARAIEQAAQLAAQDAEISANYENTRVVREIKYREIERKVRDEVEKTVYSACRLDACGLCLATAAARDEAGADCPCQPDYSLRGDVAGTPQQLDGRAAGSLHSGGEAVPRLSGSAGGIGGSGEAP